MADLAIAEDELRGAALAAEALLRIVSARAYGFVEGGPQIDSERCDEVIAEARAEGLAYTEDEIDAAMVALLGELA